MKFLKKKEKILLSILVTAAIIMIVITMYFAKNMHSDENCVVNHKIKVLQAGGHIEPEFNDNYKDQRGKMGHIDLSRISLHKNSPDIVHQDWNKIAKTISDNYPNYDAFIIVCDKDTLVYTASALSFMMENLTKPIVLVDEKLTSALTLVSKTKIPEVMVASDEKLLRGCRVVQGSSNQFKTPNQPLLTPETALQVSSDPMSIKFINPSTKVIVVKVFPGMDDTHLENALNNKGLSGVIIELYGSGTAPLSNKLLDIISRAIKRGVVIVAVTQCDKSKTEQNRTSPVETIGTHDEFPTWTGTETVNLPQYNDQIDFRLTKSGVINGEDMTTAAAYTKLCFLLGNVKDTKILGDLMKISMRGEIGDLNTNSLDNK